MLEIDNFSCEKAFKKDLETEITNIETQIDRIRKQKLKKARLGTFVLYVGDLFDQLSTLQDLYKRLDKAKKLQKKCIKWAYYEDQEQIKTLIQDGYTQIDQYGNFVKLPKKNKSKQ